MTRGKLIFKAFGYTIAILLGALILAIIVLATTANQDLTTYAFWGGVFLGMLAVLTDELKKREALVGLLSHHEQPGAAARSSAPVQALRAPQEHQIRTFTIVDVTCGVLDLHVSRWTDGPRTLQASSRSGQSDVPHHTAVMRGARQR
ncbi:MAG TPA: hypothetical protein VF844_07510 [Ktedonobacteraceae bacterium]